MPPSLWRFNRRSHSRQQPNDVDRLSALSNSNLDRMDSNVPQTFYLLLRAENRILRHLEDAELNHGFGGNLDLLFR